jgi:hypothetical protein
MTMAIRQETSTVITRCDVPDGFDVCMYMDVYVLKSDCWRIFIELLQDHKLDLTWTCLDLSVRGAAKEHVHG